MQNHALQTRRPLSAITRKYSVNLVPTHCQTRSHFGDIAKRAADQFGMIPKRDKYQVHLLPRERVVFS